MNRLGILCDLSHVGAKTSEDVILASKQRVAYSHCLPAGTQGPPAQQERRAAAFIADHGGFIGVTMFPPFLKRDTAATVDDYVEAIEYVISLRRRECSASAPTSPRDYGAEFFDWITHDKGWGRKLTDFGEVINPEGMRTIGDLPNLTMTMEKRQWSEGRIRKVMGGNWLQLLKDVWGRRRPSGSAHHILGQPQRHVGERHQQADQRDHGEDERQRSTDHLVDRAAPAHALDDVEIQARPAA